MIAVSSKNKLIVAWLAPGITVIHTLATVLLEPANRLFGDRGKLWKAAEWKRYEYTSSDIMIVHQHYIEFRRKHPRVHT